MGLTASHQPPQIVHPTDGACDVPTDTSAWGNGGTIVARREPQYAVDSAPFAFEHAGGSIEATYEIVGASYTLSPHGQEYRPCSRIRPQGPLPARTEIRLVYQGHTLASFTTGDGPARPSAPPRPCAPPSELGPSLSARASRQPGTATAVRAFAAELGEGLYVVDDGVTTVFAIGPCMTAFNVQVGATVRIRDASLRTVLETVIE